MVENIISKDLFEKSMGFKIEFYNFNRLDRSYIKYTTKYLIGSINVYELSIKVKKFAYKNGYSISTYKSGRSWCSDIYKADISIDNLLLTIRRRNAYESDFKAAQWVLENKCE